MLAASRTDPALIEPLLSLGVGGFAATVSVLIIYFGAKKQGEAMNGAFWQKLVLYGVCGLVAGYFSMRFTIRSNPELFHGKPPLSKMRLEAISNNLVPQMGQPKLSNPLASGGRDRSAPVTREQEEQRQRQAEARRAEDQARMEKQREEREERERRTAQAREEHKRRAAQAREEHERRVQKMKEEREERRRQQRAEQEAARTAEEAGQTEDEQYLLSLSVEELEAERDQRQAEKEEATADLRAPLAEGEDRATRSRRFSAAVKAYMAASRALMQKQREQRELNR